MSYDPDDYSMNPDQIAYDEEREDRERDQLMAMEAEIEAVELSGGGPVRPAVRDVVYDPEFPF